MATKNSGGGPSSHNAGRSRWLLVIPFVAIAIIAVTACQPTTYSRSGGSSYGSSGWESWETTSSYSNDYESDDSEYHEQAESHDNEYHEDLEKHD